MTLALAYALCVIGPTVALALMDADSAIHCAAKPSHRGIAKIQGHDDGATHHGDRDSSQTKSDGEGQGASCCGMFCISAMPAALSLAIVPMAGIQLAEMAIDRGIAGRGPPRIDRPPIVLLHP